MIPAQLMQTRNVKQFARRAVRFAGVKHHAPLVTHDLRDSLGQFTDGAVHTGAHVDMRQHWLGIFLQHFLSQLHHVDTGRRHIVDMQKFTHWRPASPHHHIRRILLASLMKAAQQRRDHMRITRMKVVMRSVQIGRHHRAIITAILSVIRFAQLDTGNFGNRIRLIGRFKCPLQQFTFGDWLGGLLGINTG